MRVGTVKEVKNHEYRVGLTPESVRELVANGHEVWVEAGAGAGIGASAVGADTGAQAVEGELADCEVEAVDHFFRALVEAEADHLDVPRRAAILKRAAVMHVDRKSVV